MKISKQARREARQLFRSCLAGPTLDETRARAITAHVVTRKPRGYLAILTQFQKLVKLYAASRLAKVDSAIPLGPEDQTRMKADLERTYGLGLDYVFAHKPQLIGGVRIQVGGDVYDGTILARLNALKESF
jgi:F-type H+-transporting ATPase subunit delta